MDLKKRPADGGATTRGKARRVEETAPKAPPGPLPGARAAPYPFHALPGAAPPPQRKLTIRLPAASNHLSEAAATAPGGHSQKDVDAKLTIRLPAGSNTLSEAAAPPAPQKDVGAILRNLAGYRPPPPGPQLFGPPPKARAKPTLQRTTPRAPDAGPLPSILELLEQHVAARPTSEAPPTAEETLAALGAPGDDEAPPTAPPSRTRGPGSRDRAFRASSVGEARTRARSVA
mgnify:CR=1 FL=1